MDAAELKRTKDLHSKLLTALNSFVEQSGGKDKCEPSVVAARDESQRILNQLSELEKSGKTIDGEESAALLASVLNAAQKVSETVAAFVASAAEKLKPQIEGMVTQGIADKVKAGEYLSKADAEKAVSEAGKKIEERHKLIGARRELITQAKLPAPGEDLLGGEDKDFTPALEAAREREKKLGEIGLTLNSAEYKHLAFAGQTDWETQYKMITAFAKGKKVKLNPLAAGGAGGSEDLSRLPV